MVVGAARLLPIASVLAKVGIAAVGILFKANCALVRGWVQAWLHAWL
jgi:uncharacterized membrane protein